MELRQEWEEILNNSQFLYIYGAGKIGRKAFDLIKRSNSTPKLKDFLFPILGGGTQLV